MFIEDGKGGGYTAEVNSSNQLQTIAEVHELQHHESAQHGNAFQVIGSMTPASGTNNVLYLENEHTTLEFAISYIRVQVVDLSGGTTIPSANTYFQFGFENTYTSGGDTTTPVNMNNASSKVADVTAYTNGPTLGGSFTEIDRWYVKADGEMMVFNKHGSIIMPKNKAFIVRLVTDHSAGVAYCRTTFFFLS
jgi:hypothetical protein